MRLDLLQALITFHPLQHRSAGRGERGQVIVLKVHRIIEQPPLAPNLKRDGLAFVLEKQEAGLFYAQTQFDLTNEVIRAYNALPKLAAPPPPKLPDLAKAPTANGIEKM